MFSNVALFVFERISKVAPGERGSTMETCTPMAMNNSNVMMGNNSDNIMMNESMSSPNAMEVVNTGGNIF